MLPALAPAVERVGHAPRSRARRCLPRRGSRPRRAEAGLAGQAGRGGAITAAPRGPVGYYLGAVAATKDAAPMPPPPPGLASPASPASPPPVEPLARLGRAGPPSGTRQPDCDRQGWGQSGPAGGEELALGVAWPLRRDVRATTADLLSTGEGRRISYPLTQEIRLSSRATVRRSDVVARHGERDKHDKHLAASMTGVSRRRRALRQSVRAGGLAGLALGVEAAQGVATLWAVATCRVAVAFSIGDLTAAARCSAAQCTERLAPSLSMPSRLVRETADCI